MPPPTRYFQRRHQPGTAPGTLVVPEVRRVEAVRVELIDYGPEQFEERVLTSVTEMEPYVDSESVTWINVIGLHDLEILEAFGKRLGLHPLALEDVLNTGQRPKLDDYDEHIFLVLRQLRVIEGRLDEEQISIFVRPGLVLTFQELPGDVFEPVRERLRKGRARIRGAGADYLAYALTDALVDQYFPLLEEYGERIEDLEDQLIVRPEDATLGRIHRMRKDLLAMRRSAWPMREVVNAFARQEEPAVADETKVYLRDLYDHASQIMDILETYRDLASSLLDVYLSSVSNRMNEVMKVLTVVASIFIPLTFLAGIWGMNFNPDSSPFNMPELSWYFGYPLAWLSMVAVGLGLAYYFKRKGWL